LAGQARARGKADVNQPPADWVEKPERTTGSICF
jgi:hypothetical protein